MEPLPPSQPRHAGRTSWLASVSSRLRRNLPLLLLDMVIVLAAYLAPLIIRFEGNVPERYWLNFRLFVPVCLAVYLLTNALFGLYGEMWKYASAEEARRVILSSITAGGFIVAGNALVGGTTSPL